MKIIIKYLIFQGINNSKLSFTLFIYSSPILYTLALNLQTHLNFCLIFYAHLSPLNSVLFLLQALRSSNISINNLYGYSNSYRLSHALSLNRLTTALTHCVYPQLEYLEVNIRSICVFRYCSV